MGKHCILYPDTVGGSIGADRCKEATSGGIRGDGRKEEAIVCRIRPDGCQKKAREAEKWVSQCLEF